MPRNALRIPHSDSAILVKLPKGTRIIVRNINPPAILPDHTLSVCDALNSPTVYEPYLRGLDKQTPSRSL
jgi:hypothetical protein